MNSNNFHIRGFYLNSFKIWNHRFFKINFHGVSVINLTSTRDRQESESLNALETLDISNTKIETMVMKKLDLITLVYYEPSLPENVTTKCVILMNHGKTTFNLN